VARKYVFGVKNVNKRGFIKNGLMRTMIQVAPKQPLHADETAIPIDWVPSNMP
jgi:hypothetical protein